MAVTGSPAPTPPPPGVPSAGPVTSPVGTAGPSPAMGRPEAITPPGPTPEMRRLPIGPADPH